MDNFITEKYRASVFNSDFEYFVYIERTKGVFGFRREKKLNFPSKCAYCGDANINREIEIGRPDLNLFRGVGKVPYCREHAEHIHDNILHQKVVYMPFFLIMISILVLFQEKISRIEFVGIGSIVLAITTLVASVVYIIRKKASLQKMKDLGRLEENARKFTGVVLVNYDIPVYTLGFRNKEYYDEFCALNYRLILNKVYRKKE